jgi:hypothetical protein
MNLDSALSFLPSPPAVAFRFFAASTGAAPTGEVGAANLMTKTFFPSQQLQRNRICAYDANTTNCTSWLGGDWAGLVAPNGGTY